MGLEITAFLGNAGSPQQPALEAAIKRGDAFFSDAVKMAQAYARPELQLSRLSPSCCFFLRRP